MCGIVGVAGQIGKKENAVFKDLLQVDVIRGPHSTGIAALTKHGHSKVFKRALLPNDLLQMKRCSDVFNDHQQNIALIGHNRWATLGKINGVNAHPFEFDTLVGCHNGTLRNKRKLPNHLDFETDSENLFHSFEEKGVEETIKNVDGAFALVWASFDDKTMHFLRNDERPLWYTFSKDNQSFYWASERWMLNGVLARNGVEHHDVIAFKQNHHYTLKVPTGGGKKDIEDFFMSEVEVYVPPKYIPRPHWNRQMNQGSHQRNGSQTGTGNFSKDSIASAKNGTTGDGGIGHSKKRDNAGKSESSGENKSSNRREKSTKRTYLKGDTATFRITKQTVFSGQRYIYAVDKEYPADLANDTCRFRVYLPAGSAIRKEMLEDLNLWWEGVVNGTKRSGDYVIQGNSVEPSVLTEEELAAILSVEEEEQKAIDEGWEEHVRFIKSVGDCAWCSEPLRPEENNHVANSVTVFCPDCKKRDEVKQFLN